MTVTILTGDCRDVLASFAPDSFDACVTDPPYHLTTGKKGGTGPASVNLESPYGRARVGTGFMGMTWDGGDVAMRPDTWAAVLRVLKPGGLLIAFGGTRTFHRLTCAIEDAGFEIRDCIMWVYGSGFPKSLDVSKAIDREAGSVRRVVGVNPNHRAVSGVGYEGVYSGGNTGAATLTAPATDAARQWSGWGTALKPAWEPIIVARKPMAGTVAANVQQYGTGAINVDACRVHTGENQSRPRGSFPHSDDAWGNGRPNEVSMSHNAGRWPANLIHDGSEEVVALFPESDGQIGGNNDPNGSMGYHGGARGISVPGVKDTGSAARFFYCAKASREDREEGCEHLPIRSAGEATGGREEGSAGLNSQRAGASRGNGARNHHPTVKPTDLMRYLCRLVTPPGGHVLDPFCGSGSTLKAARLEGFRATGIELSEEYAVIAQARATAGTMGLAL